MPHPSTSSAYGIWSLNEVRDAVRGDNWPNADPIVTSITRSVSTADEGDTVTFTVNTQNFTDGSTLYYNISGSGITTGDFTDSTLSGSFTVTSNSGVVSKTISEDNTTEGTETLTFNVRSGSIAGPILESTTVTINDTSLTPNFYTDPTYGTLVATFAGHWGSASYTEGTPQLSSSNVILSDSDFQTARANASSGLVYYVWGSSQENYWAFNRSDIESANVVPAPSTTINPNNFDEGSPPTYTPMHWWSETTGATLTGSDYSFMSYRATNTFSIFIQGPVQSADSSAGAPVTNITNVSKLWIFYK